jgi:hypothetical protein
MLAGLCIVQRIGMSRRFLIALLTAASTRIILISGAPI